MTPGDDPGDNSAAPPAVEGPSTSSDGELMVELNALLGRGTHYAGNLYFEGRVRIEGRFEGQIRGEDVLVIGQGAEVDGDIEVGVCIVTGGAVRAQIRARDAIELHAPALVHGNLHAPNIFIDRGVQFEGNCRMAPLDAGDLEDEVTVEASAATTPADETEELTEAAAPSPDAPPTPSGERVTPQPFAEAPSAPGLPAEDAPGDAPDQDQS